MISKGIFTISLDFELHWGVHDKRSVAAYAENLLGARKVIPQLLDLFQTYQIHATWATVGFLFFEDKKNLLNNLPKHQPQYTLSKFSPYLDIAQKIGDNEQNDPFHYAPKLIRQIIASEGQELASHSFSHYYCLEKGQTPASFEADLNAALAIAQNYQKPLKSFVFPRNQFDEEYVQICAKKGFLAYRGTENSWLYTARNGTEESLFRRAFRLLDAYWNVSGHHTYKMTELAASTIPYNIPSSRFLRPYSKKLKYLENFRLKRILKDLTHAAKHQELYHLWWHPHNFGVNTKQNMDFLLEILNHYQHLQKQFGMTSKNMGEIGEMLRM